MFSRITIVEFFSILSSWTHAKIDRLLLKYGLETIAPAPQRSTSARANLLMAHLINHPDELGPMGSNLALELIAEVLEFLQVPGCPMGFEETFPKATRSLKRDGFTIDGTKLRRVLPETVSLPAADDEVHALLREFTLTTPAGHLDQAIQAHTRGDWAAANSQLRTFVEALFDSIAHKLAPTEAGLLTSSHSRRELLASL